MNVLSNQHGKLKMMCITQQTLSVVPGVLVLDI